MTKISLWGQRSHEFSLYPSRVNQGPKEAVDHVGLLGTTVLMEILAGLAHKVIQDRLESREHLVQMDKT